MPWRRSKRLRKLSSGHEELDLGAEVRTRSVTGRRWGLRGQVDDAVDRWPFLNALFRAWGSQAGPGSQSPAVSRCPLTPTLIGKLLGQA